VSDFDDANSLEAPIATAVLAHIVRSIVDDADAVNVTSGPGKGDKVLAILVALSAVVAVLHRAFAQLSAQRQQTTMLMSTSTLSTPEQFAP
jgi:hypothetical protein